MVVAEYPFQQTIATLQGGGKKYHRVRAHLAHNPRKRVGSKSKCHCKFTYKRKSHKKRK